VTGGCIDCPPGSRRPSSPPGPRCATHHRKRTRAAKLAAHSRRVEAIYGITGEQYAALLSYQGGRCAICQRATGASKRLAVDHDHATGKVRGLLCGRCNRDVLGHLRDDPAALRRAADYLEKPPADQVLTNPPDHVT
jgi:hypothetical protein